MKHLSLNDEHRFTLGRLRQMASEVWAAYIRAMLGAPDELRARIRFTKKLNRIAADWVRHLEMLVRRIILIAALGYLLDPVRPRAARQAKPDAKPRAEKPNTRFRMTPHRSVRHGFRCRYKVRDDLYLMETAPIANRLAVLEDAITNTRVHAIRFARKLARMAAANDALANDPHADPYLISVRQWSIPSHLMTESQFAVNDAMLVANRLATAMLDHWQARWEEPG